MNNRTSSTGISPYRAILLDIEGTTTPISFVYETLFPFAARHLAAFIEAHWSEEALQSDVALLAAQAHRDADEGIEGVVAIPSEPEDARRAAVIESCRWLMSGDRKVTGLKSLQGKVWLDGYQSGELQSELFPDVADAITRWHAAGIAVSIYSSGSVAAQKLLFGYSCAGDLTPLLSDYFDTTTGPKREAESYTQIAAACGVAPGELLFLTDVAAEAQAASAAGVQAVVMNRPGNHPQPAHPFVILDDFTSL